MRKQCWIQSGSGRRRFFQTALAAAVGGLAARAGFELAVPEKVAAQSNLSPDAALQELLSGNQRFAANQLTSIEHDLTILKEKTADKQEPFAAVLSCADSRVPVELVFDQTIGHIFVTRVAGNLVTPEIIGSLEYGVGGARSQSARCAWPQRMWCCESGNESRQCSRTNQLALSAPPAGRRTIRWESRQSYRSQCEDSGPTVTHFLNRDSRCSEGGQVEGRSRGL